MTCREKLKLEKPAFVSGMYEGGCMSCPSTYGYLPDPEGDETGCGMTCTECWDREIPEEAIAEGVVEGFNTVNPEIAQAVERIVTDVKAKADEFSSIKDSGDRTQFETGAVRDMREGKGRCDLMPLGVVAHALNDAILYHIETFKRSNDTKHLYFALDNFATDRYLDEGDPDYALTESQVSMFLEVAKHFEEGAKKYGENNWQKGIPVHCYIDSAVRHYLKWLRGDKDEPHDRAFVWNIMCCIWEVDYRCKEEK